MGFLILANLSVYQYNSKEIQGDTCIIYFPEYQAIPPYTAPAAAGPHSLFSTAHFRFLFGGGGMASPSSPEEYFPIASWGEQNHSQMERAYPVCLYLYMSVVPGSVTN